ncbi:MAG: hypothetical protein HY595_01210 [Candidatus Omnitrophica bacterium]|nr:hypothetical protein [Candidatus Omnitrophota bacterium]
MKRRWSTVIGLVVGVSGMLAWSSSGFSAEHGGKEHGGTTAAPTAAKEHGGTTAAPAVKEHGGATQEHGGQAVNVEPSAEQIRQSIRDYIALIEQEEGAFTIEDEVAGTTRTLQLDQVHERVGKTGELFYSCTDMKDAENGELLDLDFDVDASGEELEVVDVRIHKVGGQPRYTYDEQDNRIPIAAAIQ